MAQSAAPVGRVFITPTVSSKPSRRDCGLRVGYASSRAHNNNDTNTKINTNYNNNYDSNNIFARALQQQDRSLGFSSCEFARARQQHQSLGFK
jgi:hypothetical protein